MRVCDGSCRHLAAIERRLLPDRTDRLIERLRREATDRGETDAGLAETLEEAATALEYLRQRLAGAAG